MKIALVSGYDFPYPGGVTEHIAHLYHRFAALGHDVSIVAPSSTRHPLPERLIRVGNVFSMSGNGSVARISMSFRIAQQIRTVMRREQFEVVHIHEPVLPMLPLFTMRFSETLNVGTFHACWKRNFSYLWTKPMVQHFFMTRLHGRIAVSEAALKFASRYFPAEYTIIPNGIEVDRFSDETPPVQALRDGKLNILFVGRLEKRKGLDHLLSAFTMVKTAVPKARLVVVGGGSALPRYREYVESEGLRDVYFTGFVPESDLPRYYRSCDIFCSPATGGESFGIVLLEAMAAGKPVVASDIEGYRGVLDDGAQGFLVPPKDEAALAHALVQLLIDGQLREEMGQLGRSKAAWYDWSRVATQVLDFYDETARRVQASHQASPYQ
jgi:phosphatidyl-myo-inositol alpha-mannosyltransferase